VGSFVQFGIVPIEVLRRASGPLLTMFAVASFGNFVDDLIIPTTHEAPPEERLSHIIAYFESQRRVR
jgi:hypothetical protein